MVGGKREGAGRKPMAPKLKKMPMALKLPQWLIEWMDTQPESRAFLIEEALRKMHKIKPPPEAERPSRTTCSTEFLTGEIHD